MFGLPLLRDVGRGDRLLPRLDHRLQRPPFVRRIAADRLDEVRDQVVAPLELHIDLGPCRLDPVAETDEPVIRQREVPGDDHQQDDDDDERDGHGPFPSRRYAR